MGWKAGGQLHRVPMLLLSDQRLLVSISAKKQDIEKVEFDEKSFRWELNENAMATDKLAEGIRKFAADAVKLEKIIKQRLATK